MKIDLDLDTKTIRMIKALGILSGKNSNEISEIVSDLLKDGLKSRLAQELDIAPSMMITHVPSVWQETPPLQSVTTTNVEDVTGISEGLGDEDDGPQNSLTTDSMTSGAITAKDIEHDMEIGDPSTEAKGESTFSEAYFQQKEAPEDIFTELAGLPALPREKRVKRNPNVRRAKVSAATSFSGDGV